MTGELENSSDEWRYSVLLRLPELGKIAAAAAPAVSRLTSSSDPMVRDAAVKALAAIQRQRPIALPPSCWRARSAH